ARSRSRTSRSRSRPTPTRSSTGCSPRARTRVGCRAMPSSAATAVTPKQVAAFRLGRQHLARRAPKAALVAVVEEMAGAQAQVLSAAQIALATRTKGLSLDDVDAAIAQRRVVKVGCMRRTLYLVPSSLVAVFVRGTARRAEQGVRWALRKGVP